MNMVLHYRMSSLQNRINEESILVNTKEATRILFGVDDPSAQRRTYRLAKKGNLKFLHDGKLFWFNREDLKRVCSLNMHKP